MTENRNARRPKSSKTGWNHSHVGCKNSRDAQKKTTKKKCTCMTMGRGRCRERLYRKTEGEKSGFPGSDVAREREGEGGVEGGKGWEMEWTMNGGNAIGFFFLVFFCFFGKAAFSGAASTPTHWPVKLGWGGRGPKWRAGPRRRHRSRTGVATGSRLQMQTWNAAVEK